MAKKRLQYGSFIPIPSAFEIADKGLRNAIQFEFKIRSNKESKNPLNLESVFYTDRCLVDFSCVNPHSIHADKIAKDCDYIKQIVSEHPEELAKMIKELQNGEIDRGYELAEKIGMTEDDCVRAGGGAIGLVIVLLAVIVLGGCGHINKGCTGDPNLPKPKAGPDPAEAGQ